MKTHSTPNSQFPTPKETPSEERHSVLEVGSWKLGVCGLAVAAAMVLAPWGEAAAQRPVLSTQQILEQLERDWVDALKRASAESVTVIMPYFSYAKGDKKDEPRVSIRARVCADAIEVAGADRVVGPAGLDRPVRIAPGVRSADRRLVVRPLEPAVPRLAA